MQIGFDNEKYLQLQSANIRKRIEQFGGKLYLEFGGKLFDDYHASRVLPGFEPDAKIKMLAHLQDDCEIIIVISADDIEKAKMRGDLGIPYDEDTLRLMDVFESLGFLVNGVCITHYRGQPAAKTYRKRLEQLGIRCYRHYFIEGYPYDGALIASDQGFGRNDFIETKRPLVVVTAPGPGSGKMATCLSQLYHEHRRGVVAGYAKFETFPIWNLSLKHPVNLAYEAATVDLDDVNMIDPFHVDAYGQTAVNYNRDIEIFPVLRDMLEKVVGESPYKSPTDMGVNMAGFCISDDEVVREASRMEIFRRYYETRLHIKRTGTGEASLEKMESIMLAAGVTPEISRARTAALLKEETTGAAAAAMLLPDGRVVTGKTSELLGPASSVIMNALKTLAGIDDARKVITDEAIEPLCALKTGALGSKNPRLHSDETLIALSISSAHDADARAALDHLRDLRGCDAFFSAIPSSADEKLFKSLGINVCCEPRYEKNHFYHK